MTIKNPKKDGATEKPTTDSPGSKSTTELDKLAGSIISTSAPILPPTQTSPTQRLKPLKTPAEAAAEGIITTAPEPAVPQDPLPSEGDKSASFDDALSNTTETLRQADENLAALKKALGRTMPEVEGLEANLKALRGLLFG